MDKISDPIHGGSSDNLRSRLRKKRTEISDEQRNSFDRSICQHIQKLVVEKNARSIACYWPFNGEPDLIPLCKTLLADGCEIALPVISKNKPGVMTFCSWQAGMPLVKNRYGIFEPPGSTCITLAGFDMLIMPLVAYDRSGNRLGMGAGYYDRHLEHLKNSPAPLRVGAAYSLQEIDPIDKNHWDIPLHGIVNERGWFTFVE